MTLVLFKQKQYKATLFIYFIFLFSQNHLNRLVKSTVVVDYAVLRTHIQLVRMNIFQNIFQRTSLKCIGTSHYVHMSFPIPHIFIYLSPIISSCLQGSHLTWLGPNSMSPCYFYYLRPTFWSQTILGPTFLLVHIFVKLNRRS